MIAEHAVCRRTVDTNWTGKMDVLLTPGQRARPPVPEGAQDRVYAGRSFANETTQDTEESMIKYAKIVLALILMPCLSALERPRWQLVMSSRRGVP